MKLAVRGIYFSYDSVDVLRDVTLEVVAGEVLSIVGPNGSGKSTLLRCFNKILKPQKGTVLLGEMDLRHITQKHMARLVAHVPQSTSSPFPATVYDTVLLGRRPHLGWGIGARDRAVVAQTLTLMGLKELALRQLNQLSGGERQKVLIARALAQEPEVLLLDEPTSSLDLRHQLEVLGLIRTVVKKKGISAIMAIHDLNLAARFSDSMVFLKGGRVYAAGEPGNIITVDNIRFVYGIEVIVNGELGKPHIIPVGPA